LTRLELIDLNVTDLTPLLVFPVQKLELGNLGSKGVSSQVLLNIPSLKEVRFYGLYEVQKQELNALLIQKPDFKIYHDGKLLNP
jgi:hypothetical protein